MTIIEFVLMFSIGCLIADRVINNKRIDSAIGLTHKTIEQIQEFSKGQKEFAEGVRKIINTQARMINKLQEQVREMEQ